MNDEKTTFDKAYAKNYTLSVKVGDPILPDGQTNVSLDGDGCFSAQLLLEPPIKIKRKNGKTRSDEPYKGKLPQSLAVDLLQKASQFPWNRSFPSRKGIPDEAIVIWQFGRKGEKPVELKVWLREAESDPVLKPVLSALREGLAQLSESALYL